MYVKIADNKSINRYHILDDIDYIIVEFMLNLLLITLYAFTKSVAKEPFFLKGRPKRGAGGYTPEGSGGCFVMYPPLVDFT